MGHLGDLVMVEPALRWLLASGAVDLSLTTDPHYVRLFASLLPGVAVHGSAEALALRPPDAVLDLHRVRRSRTAIRAITDGSNTPTIRVHKEGLRRRLLVFGPDWARNVIGRSQALAPRRTWPQRHLEAAGRALRQLGVKAVRPWHTADCRPSLPRPSMPVSAKAPVLGMAIGGRHGTKRWPIEAFGELAQAWRVRTGGGCAVLAGPSEAEEAMILQARTGAESATDSSLGALAVSASRCSVVVGGDTGPLHLAAAFGVPVVGLFGPTPVDAGFWVWGAGGRALRPAGLSCSPCTLHGTERCPRGHRRCLDECSALEVLEVALTLLPERRQCA